MSWQLEAKGLSSVLRNNWEDQPKKRIKSALAM